MGKSWLPPRLRRARAALRRRLAESQGHRCAYCGVRFGARVGKWLPADTRATIDHVAPRSAGGVDDWENMVAACHRCNRIRANEDAFTFFERRGWISTSKDRAMERAGWLEKAIRKAMPRPWQ